MLFPSEVFCSYFSDCACGLLCIAEKDKNVKKYIFANCKSLFLCMGRTGLYHIDAAVHPHEYYCGLDIDGKRNSPQLARRSLIFCGGGKCTGAWLFLNITD